MGSLCWLFPKVFRVVSDKESSLSDCHVVSDGGLVWDVTFGRGLLLPKQIVYGEFFLTCFYAYLIRTLGFENLPHSRSSRRKLFT